jgi:2-hydroxychromene-2-carboxylate isomerase
VADIECFFDCSSPWTYFAFHNLLLMRGELGIDIAWRPILVGGVFNAVNPSVHSSREKPVPAKVAYNRKDQEDWARHLGIRMHYRPTVFPVNSVRAMRACVLLWPEDKLVAFAQATFEAYWGDDKDISQVSVLREICQKVGVNSEKVLAGIEQQVIKDQLRAITQELIDRGGFGSPTIYVGGDDMYFGNDRMPLIREAVLRRRRAAHLAPRSEPPQAASPAGATT